MQIPTCARQLAFNAEAGQGYKARVSGFILDLGEDRTHLIARKPIPPGELSNCACSMADWSGTEDALCVACEVLLLLVQPHQQLSPDDKSGLYT